MRLVQIALLFLIALTSAATAATIRPIDHPNCDFKLEGEISKGDTAQLEQIPGRHDGQTLCLNSPGGSLGEGKRLFDVIWARNIMTRVLAEDRCESACAIAFLGGSINTGTANIRFQQRVIEAGARLGFHAPSLDLPQDRSYPADLINKAFSAALQSAEDIHAIKLHEEHSVVAMQDFLYQRILSTRPEDMYFIATVGDAAMSGIAVDGLKIPAKLTKREVANMCDNAWVATQADMRPGYRSAAEYYAEIGNGFYDKRNVSLRQEGATLIGQVSDYYSAVKFGAVGCEVRLNETQFRRARNNGAGDIWVSFYKYFGDEAFGSNVENSQPPSEVRLPLWFAMDPITPLPAMTAAADAGRAVSRDDFVPFRGIDLFGGDLPDGMIRRVASSATCIERCIARKGCDVATHDRWNKICYLKSVDRSDRRLYVLSKATTWIKTPRDGDVFNAGKGVIRTWTRKDKGFRDRPYDVRTLDSQRACERACFTRDCLGFNWTPANRQCALFSEPDAYFDARGVVAGFKQQERVE